MYCPNCGYKQMCGCSSSYCKNKVKESELKPERHDESGNLIICANCGLTAHYDWWSTLEWEVFNLFKGEEING